ncbi:hypothetical protein QH494_27350 [Sphingomonas sp. AR_OL41]|nr:hypothetical protein [Sphingomonas sp. AR_OL41]
MIILDDAFLEDQARARCGTIWLVAMFGLGALAFLLDWFDSTTELAPAHHGIATLGRVAATLACLTAAVIGFRVRRPRRVADRLFRASWYALLGFLAVYFALTEIATIVVGWRDFPATGSRSSQRLIAIADASHYTVSKGSQRWMVTTRSFGATLDITREDYGFMLAHRRAGDDASEPDAIASDGHFCARVTVEQAGSALRVIHAGSYTLPQGTIVLCPAGEVSL